MKIIALLVVLIFATISATIAAESPGFWRDSDGKAAADTPDRRSVAGFGGWLLVTSDLDWRAKWDSPRETVPKFNVTNSPRRGQKVFVLIFLGIPKLDANRGANVKWYFATTTGRWRFPCVRRLISSRDSVQHSDSQNVL